MKLSREKTGERAFTLVEALLAASVLAMAITAVTLPFAAGARNQQEEMRQTLAVSLAEELMEEILLKEFEEPADGDRTPEPADSFGPEADEAARTDFDAIDDYDGLEETPGTLTHPDGTPVTDAAAAGMSRHVSVQYVDVIVPGQDLPAEPCFFQVTVEVRREGRVLARLVRLVHWIEWLQ